MPVPPAPLPRPRRDRLRRFRSGPHRTERLAAALVAQPRSLLVTLLLGNMIVTSANAGAQALYASLGMEIVGHYHYRSQ